MEYLFWIPAFLIFHSYLLYPLILLLLNHKKKENSITYHIKEELPTISVLMAAHNEEAVVAKKIESIFATNYPVHKIEVLIGSDSSTDNTNNILLEKSKIHPNLQFFLFDRRGKANTINELVDKSTGEIIISTDANVFFTPPTIFELVKHFKNEQIGLVDSRMRNTGIQPQGISIQESRYIGREVLIKNREGKIWGSMMGPFGGCFAIRRCCYSKVPATFFMDDFYICMRVLEQRKMAINSLEANVYEDVSNQIKEEFRRKVRISIGNFQNLFRFKGLLWPPWKGRGFAFLSHKAIRWFGPILIIIALMANISLALNHNGYIPFLVIFGVSFLLPPIDFLLKRINIHITFVRFITHFYGMNLALLVGFFKFIKGVKSNVWQPTQRNQ